MPSRASQLMGLAQRLIQDGTTFAICTLVRPENESGSKLLVDLVRAEVVARSGLTFDPGLERELIAEARRLQRLGQSKLLTLGEREVFVDVHLPNPRLLIVGAVHIAAALCEMAALSGFEVTVIDPRAALNNRERFPRAKHLIVGWPEDELPALRIDENTFIAVLTHDEKFDDPTVLHALRTPARYVGAIGSKKTQALRRERLQAAGLSDADINRVHGPIGLDIGAQSPEEIAVAILSEMIAVKYHHTASPLRDRSEPHIHA